MNSLIATRRQLRPRSDTTLALVPYAPLSFRGLARSIAATPRRLLGGLAALFTA